MAITQGKWWYDERSEGVGSDSGWVCSLSQRERKGDQEFGDVNDDGNLIADAPELLEVCKELVELVDGFIDGIYLLDSFTAQPAHAVIARIEGKSNATSRTSQQGSGE